METCPVSFEHSILPVLIWTLRWTPGECFIWSNLHGTENGFKLEIYCCLEITGVRGLEIIGGGEGPHT